jgi:thiol-disulfide isomerase/thioredoxin
MKIHFLIILVIGTIGCKQNNNIKNSVTDKEDVKHRVTMPKPDFYKNLYTQELLNESEIKNFRNSLIQDYPDSIKHKFRFIMMFHRMVDSAGYKIQPFSYDLRIGTDYIKRYYSYDKIGMNISPREFRTIKGKLIQIGGEQSKPTMINLWFTRCRGCVQEIPALNELQKRYKRKVNFVAMTFDDATEVEKFLEKKKFKFHHITKARSMINEIGTKPYPENIFTDKFGNITHIERGLPYNENSDMDVVLEHFESIIEELLTNSR